MKCVLKVLTLMAIPGMAVASNYCLPVVGTVKLESQPVGTCTIAESDKVPAYQQFPLF